MSIPNSLFIIVDILIAAIILFCIIKGAINGFVYELINFLFLGLSFVVGWFLSPIFACKLTIFKPEISNELASKLMDATNLTIIINNYLWLIIIVLILNLIFMLIKPLFKSISKIPFLGFFNRIFGSLLGAIRGFVICLLVSALITSPIVKNGNEVKAGTLLNYVDDITNASTNFILENINIDSIKDNFEDFDVDKAREELSLWLSDQGILDE